MECRCFSPFFIMGTFFLLFATVFFSGCSKQESFITEYQHFTPPPDEITIEQLLSDYMTDEDAADVKYKWKRFLFTEVEVEEVFGTVSFFDFGYEAYRKTHFMSGNVKFTDLLDFNVAMQNIEVGYVLNVVGECRGLKGGIVSIHDCWVESIKGDLGKVVQGDPEY